MGEDGVFDDDASFSFDQIGCEQQNVNILLLLMTTATVKIWKEHKNKNKIFNLNSNGVCFFWVEENGRIGRSVSFIWSLVVWSLDTKGVSKIIITLKIPFKAFELMESQQIQNNSVKYHYFCCNWPFAFVKFTEKCRKVKTSQRNIECRPPTPIHR